MLRNHIKFLVSAAGLFEIRMFVVEKFEQWVQNSKMVKPVQELLYLVAINSYQRSPDDIKLLETFLNVKLKTRLFSQHYVACIKEFINAHQDNLKLVIQRVVTNELTQNVRQSTNIQILMMSCQNWPNETATVLGVVFQDFLCFKEDYLRSLRIFLREIVRRSDNFPISIFTRSLMQERNEVEFTNLDQNHKERVALSLADLITCSAMLLVTTPIRESYTNYSKGDKSAITVLKIFFDSLSVIQCDGVWWVHSVLPGFLRPQPTDYKTCLRKVLFLEPLESYFNKDNWPSESERELILQLMTESTLNGDSLMRILVIGLDRDLPLSASDAIDIADKLVARAANVHTNDIPRVPSLDRRELFNAIFDITAYRPPSSITFPKFYKPPDLAISKLYWKGWILLLVLAAFNPKSIGSIGWKEYPTLQSMMIMVMTNNYTSPVPLNKMKIGKTAPSQDEQMSQKEKDIILKYENHLSSGETVVTEATSYLLNHVTQLDPRGPVRRIPSSALDLIKTVNSSLKLGQLLCQCREPDFLLEVIQEQGTTQAMSWLRNLIEGQESSLDILPIPCLCEFLITSYQEKGTHNTSDNETSHRAQFKRKQRAKGKIIQQHEQMINRLQLIVNSSDPSACLDVLQYFIGKLSSPYSLQALQDILSPPKHGVSTEPEVEDDHESSAVQTSNTSWLLNLIPSIAVFPFISSSLIDLLIEASIIELNTELFMANILFITSHSVSDKIPDTSISIASIISRRFAFFKNAFNITSHGHILSSMLDMFHLTLQAHIDASYELSSDHKDTDLCVLSLPSVNVQCEMVIVSQLLEACFLCLSLVASSSDMKSSDLLLQLLLPDDANNTAQVLAMSTRQPQPLIKEKTFEHILCNVNSVLVCKLVSHFQPRQLCRFVSLCGVSVVNMDVILGALDKVVQFEGGSDWKVLIDQIEVHHLRGCCNGRIYLSFLKTKHNLDVLPPCSLPELLARPCPQRQPSLLSSPLVTSQRYTLSHLEEASSQVLLDDKFNRIDELLFYLLNLLSSGRNTKSLSLANKQVITHMVNDIRELLNKPLEIVQEMLKNHKICRLIYVLTLIVLRYNEGALLSSLLKCLQQMQIESDIITICIEMLSPSSGLQLLSYSSLLKGGSLDQISSHLEENLLSLADHAINNGLQEQFIGSLLQLNDNQRSRGVMFDVIEIVDPELVYSCVHSYLFTHSNVKYLLEKFIHHVSMPVLHQALSNALDGNIKNINSSNLLDLLWNCLHSPSLWQGKVKKEAVIDASLSLSIDRSLQLELSTKQLHTVIDCVFNEMTSSSDDVINHRVPLMMTCSKGKLDVTAKYITSCSSTDKSHKLLSLLYHGNEAFGKYISGKDVQLNQSLPSVMDCYLHYLLTSMATASTDDSGIQKMTAASLLCRQISVTHPMLMMRQLPLLGWLLRGRAHLSPKQFSELHHQVVFNNAFHLLYLLEPVIFHHPSIMECCLIPFMDYLKYQCVDNASSHSLAGKLLLMLNRYCQHSCETAQMFLSQHCETLHNMKSMYPKQQKVIDSILSMLPSAQSLVPDTYSKFSKEISPSTVVHSNLPSSSTPTHSYAQVLPFIKKLESNQPQETVLQVLKDLDDTSLRSVEILQYFVPILCKIIQSSNVSCRKIAHDIILRHLRHKPSSFSDVLPSILTSLNSPDFSIVIATVPYVPELILLSSAKDAAKLMSILFELAIISPLNCNQELKRTITLLTSHIAI
jgi:integrator complex subunit 1